ncbi:MAG: hypothetical protein ACLQPH_17875 [Acidimicrobiales bacterium]
MSNATLPAWTLVAVTLGSALLGAMSGPIVEWLRRGADEKAREKARADSLSDRRDEFQRQTIVDTQDAVLALTTATGLVMDQMATGHPSTKAVEEALDTIRTVSNRADVLRVRILNDEVRASVKRSIADLRASLAPGNETEAPVDSTEAVDDANKALGAAIRELWTGKPATPD